MDDKPDAVIIHIGTNNILTKANHEEIAHNIIKIGLNCKNHGVIDVVISSVFAKKNPNLNALPRHVNDSCVIYVARMVLVIFVMMQLQQSTFGKMEFIDKIWVQIF